MAVEVDVQAYKFINRQGEEGKIDVASFEALRNKAKPKRNITLPWRYNPIHEFESVWWMGVYVIFRKSPVSIYGRDPSPHDYELQRCWTANLFETYTVRGEVIGSDGEFSRAVSSLHEDIMPIGLFLETLRIRLIQCYRKVENDVEKIDYTSAGDLGVDFCTALSSISRSFQQGDITVGEFFPEGSPPKNASTQMVPTVNSRDDAAVSEDRVSSSLDEETSSPTAQMPSTQAEPGDSSSRTTEDQVSSSRVEQTALSKSASPKPPRAPGKRVKVSSNGGARSTVMTRSMTRMQGLTPIS